MTVNGPVNVTYKKVNPMDWPQDKVTIPPGNGGMTRIEFSNKYGAGQQGFIYGFNAFAVPSATIGRAVIQIAPDADFWCNAIVMQAKAANATSYSPKIQIKDTRTDYRLLYPFGRLHNFQVQTSTNTAGIPASCRRLGGTLHRPYCFTRNGGIEVSINNQSGADETYYIGFIGWKEYANVSR